MRAMPTARGLVAALLLLAPASAGAFDLADVVARAEALRGGTLPGAAEGSGVDARGRARGGDDLRPVARHPLPAGPRALARPRASLRGAVLPPRPRLRPQRPGPRGRGRRGAGRALRRPRFDYGKNKFASRIPRDVGYAGLRVHYPLKRPDYRDEVIVFLGASYFRALGRDNVYGLSARGIAVDTVLPSGRGVPVVPGVLARDAGEGRRPPRDPRAPRRAERGGRLPLRRAPRRRDPGRRRGEALRARRVAKLGIAPLTSMFFFGENTTRCFDDFRPEVHDSDGLLVHFESGEWLWRPLDNPGASTSRASPPGTRAVSASSSATAPSRASRTPRRAWSCGRAPGSSPGATGARATSSSC